MRTSSELLLSEYVTFDIEPPVDISRALDA